MLQPKYYLLLSILLFSVFSCKNPKEYSVPEDFSVYVSRFETEATARGRNFDLKGNGLIVEFADLKNNEAGLCHYEVPIRIEIDKTYWNAISKTAGADLMKEDLLFHELGHGILGRKHINTLLENGDWKSIMCGGDQLGDRPWNINYRGIRRAYYLDELFNESTPAPDFSSTQLLADTSGYKTSLLLSFNSTAKSDVGFDLVDNADYKTSIDNGRLHFQSKINKNLLFLAQTNINIRTDFSFETTFDYPVGDIANQYGLVFGTSADSTNNITESIEYFTINNNKKMYMGNRTWYSYYTELTENSIIPSVNNKLKVIKINSMLYYFINDVYCYSTEIEDKQDGNLFGFIVPPNAEMWMDNFWISQKGTIKTSIKGKLQQSFDVQIIKSETANQNKILNR